MIVIKVGGGEEIDLDTLCDELAWLWRDGLRTVLVHGGAARLNRVAEALGRPPRFLTSPSGFTSRYTDRETLEVFEMVYCGSQNKGLVERLQRRGVNAIGLSGLDAGLWRGKRKKAIRALEKGRLRMVRDSFTGTVEQVDGALLRGFLERDLLPVLCPPALSEEGEAINVDGDRAAAATAAALGADTLLLLSNVPGLLRSFPDESSLVPALSRDRLDSIQDHAEGRMRIKLLGAREALEGGVKRVVIGDARGERCIRRALDGQGTIIE